MQPVGTVPITVIADREGAWRAIGVAADQMAAESTLRLAEAAGKAGHPGACRRKRKRQREQIDVGLGAFGGEVGDVHRECLPGDVGWIVVGKEVHALAHRIGLDDERRAGGRIDDGAIVPEAVRAGIALGQRRQIRLDDVLFTGKLWVTRATHG